MTSNGRETPQAPAGCFVTTHWSVVLTAGGNDSTRARAALEQLCRNYWHPLYAYVRGSGYSREEAEDLTQEFFARLLAHNSVARADPARGRFRSFLLASLKHFLANEWEKARALKRGGGAQPLPLEFDTAETRCAQPVAPAQAEPPRGAENPRAGEGCGPEIRRALPAGGASPCPPQPPPEQMEKTQLVDHRADIYSLGVVFYEMLTGELPLGKFQPPSRKVQVDVRLDEVVLHALEKEPERRYQRASEVKTDLEAIVGTAAISEG